MTPMRILRTVHIVVIYVAELEHVYSTVMHRPSSCRHLAPQEAACRPALESTTSYIAVERKGSTEDVSGSSQARRMYPVPFVYLHCYIRVSPLSPASAVPNQPLSPCLGEVSDSLEIWQWG
jgi:hypothetical protein